MKKSHATCQVCGEYIYGYDYGSGRARKYCSDECAREAKLRKQRKSGMKREIKCERILRAERFAARDAAYEKAFPNQTIIEKRDGMIIEHRGGKMIGGGSSHHLWY